MYLKIVAAGLAICVTGAGIWEMHRLNNQLIVSLQQTQSNETRLLNQIDHIDQMMDGQLTAARAELDNHLDEIIRTVPILVDQRASSIQNDLNKQVGGLRSDVRDGLLPYARTLLESYATLPGVVAGMAHPIQDSAQQINQALPLYLDCEYNPDCVFNRYQGSMKAFEQTMKVIADEAPKVSAQAESVAQSSAGIAADMKKEADQLTGPQTFWAKFRTWLLTIARVYGAVY